MSAKHDLESWTGIGTVCLNSFVPDLARHAAHHGVDEGVIELDRAPAIGLRVGWTNASPAQRHVTLDVCHTDLVNPRHGGVADTRALIQRLELTRGQALALAHLLADAARAVRPE